MSPDTEDRDHNLDAALLETTPRLAASLQRDEVARWRRRTYTLGALAAVATLVAALSTSLLLVSRSGAEADITTAERAADLNGEGWRLWQASDYTAAEFKFQRAVDLDPQLAHAWNGLGWSRFNAGKSNAAMDAFQQCLAIEPNHAAALNGMGQAELAQGNHDQAEQWLLKAAPNAPAAWWGLTRLYLTDERYEDAAKWAQRILEDDQQNPEAKSMYLKAIRGLKAAAGPVAPHTAPRPPDPSKVWVKLLTRDAPDTTGPKLVLKRGDEIKTIFASADTMLISYLADGVFGGFDRMSISANDTNRVLLNFASIAWDDGAMPDSATLVLEARQSTIPLVAPMAVHVHLVSALWDENQVSWNNQPEYDPQPVAEGTIPPSEGTVEIDITPLLQGLADKSHPFYGLLIKVTEPAQGS